MKNTRRRIRRQRRARKRAELRWIERERQNPEDSIDNANFDEALINQATHRCTGCRGTGWKERRHKPVGRVVCRVCQGHGIIWRWPGGYKITPLGTVSKVYWIGRWQPQR